MLNLLAEGKTEHLQTYGYQLDSPTAIDNAILSAYQSRTVRQTTLCMNKQSMVTKNWQQVYQMLGDE